jgi:hypothetical protein
MSARGIAVGVRKDAIDRRHADALQTGNAAIGKAELFDDLAVGIAHLVGDVDGAARNGVHEQEGVDGARVLRGLGPDHVVVGVTELSIKQRVENTLLDLVLQAG